MLDESAPLDAPDVAEPMADDPPDARGAHVRRWRCG